MGAGSPPFRSRLGLGPRQLLRAGRDQLRQRDRERPWPGRARRRVSHRARSREPVHETPGGAGNDRVGTRRDGTGTHRHGDGHRAAAPAQADGHPLRTGVGRGGCLLRDRRDSRALGRRTPTIGNARPAADPADVRAAAPDPDLHRGIPQGIRDACRSEGRRLPGAAGRVGPVPCRNHRTSSRGRNGRGQRPEGHRDGWLPPHARGRDAPRGAQPREARAVRDLHDVSARRRVPGTRGIRAGPARQDRSRVAGR